MQKLRILKQWRRIIRRRPIRGAAMTQRLYTSMTSIVLRTLHKLVEIHYKLCHSLID